MNSLYNRYIHNFSRRLDIILLANKYDNILNNNNQIGGKLHIIELDGYKFRIDISKDEDLIMIELQQSDGQPPSCATVLINKEGICALQGIGIHEKCVLPPYSEKKGYGSLLLKFIIRFLQVNRDKLKLKRIELRDESTRACIKCNKNIRLTTMYTLLYGDTWYGKYGFKPIVIDNEVRTKELQIKYEKNKEIINSVLVKDIPLLGIMMDASIKSGVSVNKQNLEKYLEHNKDKLLKDILNEFLKRYEDYCCLVEYMTDDLFHILKLENFEGKTFYMDI